MFNPEFALHELVYDDLTREKVQIIGIQMSVGKCDGRDYHGVIWGYWVNHSWLGGGRHPWEITKLDERESNP